MSFLRNKVLPWILSHKILLGLLAVLAALLGAAYYYRWEIEEKVIPPKPQEPRTVTIGKASLTLQELNTRDLTSESVDRIINFFVKDNVFYLARRSSDGTTTTLAAFDLKNGTLFPHREFGVKGIMTLRGEKLSGLTVNTTIKTGAGGRAFGSISSKEIAEECKNQHGITLDKKKIVLDDAIKAPGTYNVQIKLHPQVTGTLSVKVTEA